MGKKTGRNPRLVKKRKLKVRGRARLGVAGKRQSTKRTPTARGCKDGGESQSLSELAKQRTLMLKRHAKEKVVLKHHLRELQDRKSKIIRGQNARLERRELGKYIRQLQEEQCAKHQREKDELNTLISSKSGSSGSPQGTVIPAEDTDGVASVEELRRLFANIV